MERVPGDTNYLVASVDSRDTWHTRAAMLSQSLKAANVKIWTFDICVAEAASVIARRCEEQRRQFALPGLIQGLLALFEPTGLMWTSDRFTRLFQNSIELLLESRGALNFNDALIALVCQEAGGSPIISFDRDFDAIPWLHRIHDQDSLAAALQADPS